MTLKLDGMEETALVVLSFPLRSFLRPRIGCTAVCSILLDV